MAKKRIHIFEAPLSVIIAENKARGKSYIINLNNYRNWHYRTSNNIKIAYKEAVMSQFEGLTINAPVSISLVYYKGSNRRSDRANVLSIHEKFFCDALVEAGCIPDDNDIYIKQTTYLSGGIDRRNPRVEIIIEEL